MAHFTVIGLGRFGLTASLELMHLGHTVTGIDLDRKLAEHYAEEFTQTLICDATDEFALRELNLEDSEAVLIAIGEDMQASLLCTLHVKNLGVENIWVKANSAAHHTILSKLGVTRIVHPEEEMGVRVAQALNYPMVSDYLAIGHNMYVVDIHLSNDFSESELSRVLKGGGGDVSCLLIKRGRDMYRSPKSDFKLLAGDTVLLCGPRESLIDTAPHLQ